MATRDPNKYPRGWSAARVRGVIERQDAQSEADAIAAADAAWENSRTTLIRVPVELAGEVRSLIQSRGRQTTQSNKKTKPTKKRSKRAA